MPRNTLSTKPTLRVLITLFWMLAWMAPNSFQNALVGGVHAFSFQTCQTKNIKHQMVGRHENGPLVATPRRNRFESYLNAIPEQQAEQAPDSRSDSDDSLSEQEAPTWIQTMPDPEQQQNQTLYNAAPFFTGLVVSAMSLAVCGYMVYAGLSGDDPLTGHPMS